MSTIAFIGLGIMGSPMAVHLAKAGHQVVGYNRIPERTQASRRRRRQPRPTRSPRPSPSADVVAMMVPDSPDVQAVLDRRGRRVRRTPSRAR